MRSQGEERAAVVAAARGWRGTPFRHHSAVKGAGVDCAHLLLESFVEAELVERFDPGHYPADWHLHRDEERFAATVERYARRIDDSEAPLAERGPGFTVAPGDVLIWRHGRTFSHGAIASDWPLIVHASFPRGCCLEESALGQETEFKPMRLYSYWSGR